MSLLDLLRGLPPWAKELPPHLRPSSGQIRRLEAIRVEAGINHSDFLEHLAGHPATTRRVQRYFYEQIRHQMPTASEKEVLRQLIMSRLTALVEQGSDLFGLTAIGNEEAKFMARIDQIVSQHNNIESLIDVMTEDEARRELAIPPSPEYEDAARRVSEILAKS